MGWDGWDKIYMNRMEYCVRIEAPRVRTILTAWEPIRLAFPYVVFVEPTRREYSLVQYVYVSPEIPTWQSHLYEFPLTWHLDEHKLGIFSEVQHLSHIDESGRVCYDGDAMLSYSRGLTCAEVFWGSEFVRYDRVFVNEWQKLSKQDEASGREHALRHQKSFGLTGFIGALRPMAMAKIPLKVGVNSASV